MEVWTNAPHVAGLASAWITDQGSNKETIILTNDTFERIFYISSIGHQGRDNVK